MTREGGEGNRCGDQGFDIRPERERLSLPPACQGNNAGFRVCPGPVPDGRQAEQGCKAASYWAMARRRSANLAR